MAADTREDTVPPATDDLTPVTPTLDPRRTPPEIDVPALSAMLLVKVGVQFGLFGGAILQLGTKPHHDAYLRDLVTGQPLVDAFGVPPEMLRSPDLLG